MRIKFEIQGLKFETERMNMNRDFYLDVYTILNRI